MLDEVLDVDGFAAPGWGGVRDAFAENFARRGEAGAAVRGPDLAAIGMTETALGLGFNLPTAARPLGGPGSFGSVGLGGCRAWALPEAALAFAYLPSQLLDVNPDPRDLALTTAALAAIR
jgi:CubicO group peptidase (beta-lactamase class C family)